MRFFYIILFVVFQAFGLEIISNYPLPKNNIKEVYNSLNKKEDIVKFLKKTESFLDIKYEKNKLYLIRKPLIRKIIIKGNKSYWDREIKGISGVYEGKYISQEDFSIIPLKLKQFYFDNGFLDAEIYVKLETDKDGNSTIFIKINENKKYRIKNIKFLSDKNISPKIQKKYEKILNLKNKNFNFSNVQSSIDKLLQEIKKEGYYDAFVSIFSLHKLNKKEILLYINIVHGFKYKIRFVGNYSINDKTLLKYSEFEENGVNYYQIQKFAEKIQQFYRSKGFLDASVDYSYNEFLEKKEAFITIYIYEGKRYKVSTVKINSDHNIPKDIKEKLKKLENKYFEEQIFIDILENYINNLNKNGYKNAYYTISYKKNDGRLNIFIEIYKGRKFIIKSVKFKGYKPKIKLRLPTVYNGNILVNILENIKTQLKNDGYLDATAKFKIDLKERKGEILVNATYYINTGKQYKTSVPFIYGTWHLKPKVIKWNIKENEVFKKEITDNQLNFLYNSYIFNFINPDFYIEKQKGKVYKIFVLGEDKRGLFQGTIGYNSIEKLKASLLLILKNLFSYGFEINGYVDASQLNTNYNLSFGNRLLPKYSSLFLSVFSSLQNHKYYDVVKKGGRVEYSKRPNKWVRQFLILSYEKNNLKNTNVFTKNPYELFRLFLGLDYDNRNNKIFPTSGFYFRGNAGKTFSDVEYFFGNFSFRYYYKIFSFVLTQNFASGGNFISIDKLPISERYFLGSFYTIRGFGYEEISNNGKGGNSYVYINTDLRFPIFPSFNLYGFLFFDTGNIFENRKEYKKFKLRKTAGIGILVPTPAGAFMFDYAQVLDRKAGENKFRIEFSINVVF